MSVETWVRHRSAHVHLRGEMEHNLGSETRDGSAHCSEISDVVLFEFDPCLKGSREILHISSGQIVDDQDFGASADEAVDEVGTDEARPTGYQRSHRATVPTAVQAGGGLSEDAIERSWCQERWRPRRFIDAHPAGRTVLLSAEAARSPGGSF
jgi:hypothetical protein